VNEQFRARAGRTVPTVAEPFVSSETYKILGGNRESRVQRSVSSWEEKQPVHFVRIGNRALNLDRVTHCEVQVWHDAVSVKIYMTGTANNTPVVLSEDEAKQFWKYIEYVAEKPV
jgi:hypothetical protein